MQQLDLFEQTLEKKIDRLEKWMLRLQKEMWWLKSIHSLTKRGDLQKQVKTETQCELFDISEVNS